MEKSSECPAADVTVVLTAAVTVFVQIFCANSGLTSLLVAQI